MEQSPLLAQQEAYRTLSLDLSPGRWIWFPSQRTLPNTFVLFRRTFFCSELPRRLSGWLTADSRYLLTLNGERVQWGPAPSDPRWLDVDAVDLTALVQPGLNVLGVEVLYYGHGDGTWPAGKPGLIAQLTLEWPDGRVEELGSDSSWQSFLDRAHRPGQYKRWYLRALQEEFDARIHPQGWQTSSFRPDQRWLPALELNNASDQSAAASSYHDYLYEAGAAPGSTALLARQIPPMQEYQVPALRLQNCGRVHWMRNPEDWFDFRVPGSYHLSSEPLVHNLEGQGWEFPATPRDDEAIFATFEFAEQLVGWPYLELDAPEGTIIELLYQESHDPSHVDWLDTHHFAWSRLLCREGLQTYQPFEFESLRWLQLHIRNASRPVKIRTVAMLRRVYSWAHQAQIDCGEPALQRLFSAALNTMNNCAQETCVDGMGRERQQYSGDCGHQLHVLRFIYGENRLPTRFLRTFSEGLTLDGYFLDSWPAYDRLARLAERQTGMTGWGPMLDHTIGFVFDCWHHYLETGDLAALRIPYPRLLKAAAYLERLLDKHGLLPVEDLGVPTVWIDHTAYTQQRHKQCAFNLYSASMLQYAFAPLARAFHDDEQAKQLERFGRQLLQATIARFWSPEHRLFVNNLPWLAEEQQIHLCDRSLATSILYDQCPESQTQAALHALATYPAELGLSYPANAGWRARALARGGRIDVVLKELRERWATMPSVLINHTLSEFWEMRPDSTDQWSHCPIAPLFVLAMDIVGLQPIEPGFARYLVRPQLGDLPSLDITLHTPLGAFVFHSQLEGQRQRIRFVVPSAGIGELVLPTGVPVDFPRVSEEAGLVHYHLQAGQVVNFQF